MNIKHSKLSNGFTIVEMMVVVAAIAILASLSVAGFYSWRQGLTQRQVQSDLQQAAAAMEDAKNFGSGYPTSIPSTFKGSNEVSVTFYSSNGTSYCIDGVSTKFPSVHYFIDSTQGKDPILGTCAGGEEVPGGANAQAWTARAAAEANAWQSIAYGNGLFVAVSNSGTNRVMTSSDGATWTGRTLSGGLATNAWQSVAYGNGLFVAVAQSGTNRVMTSPDGINWTARNAPEANTWWNVLYAGGQFVSVARSGVYRVMTSPDGITWTARTAAEANEWYSVTYGNGTYVAISKDGTNRIMTSPDGITWTARSVSANTWRSVAYGNGLFIAVGINSVMTSPDGITWTARSAPSGQWYCVTYGNGILVATDSTFGNVMTSPDGVSWTSQTPAEANGWTSVKYGAGRFVAVAVSGTNRVMTSP